MANLPAEKIAEVSDDLQRRWSHHGKQLSGATRAQFDQGCTEAEASIEAFAPTFVAALNVDARDAMDAAQLAELFGRMAMKKFGG